MNAVTIVCPFCEYRIKVPVEVAISDAQVTTAVVDPDAAETHFQIHYRYCAMNPEATPL